MGIRLIGVIALALGACAPQGQTEEQSEPSTGAGVDADSGGTIGLQETHAGDLSLALANDGMSCDVVFGEEFLSLDLPPPCRFLERGDTGRAAVEDYGAAGAVMLIAGPLAAESDYARSEDRAISDQCSHMAQALIVKDGGVEKSGVLLGALAFCARAAPDEKFYYGIAHPDG